MKLLTHLPEKIQEKGITFIRVNKPFDKDLIAQFKKEKKKYRIVQVLSRNLRKATNLYGKPYQPTKWIFVEKKD